MFMSLLVEIFWFFTFWGLETGFNLVLESQICGLDSGEIVVGFKGNIYFQIFMRNFICWVRFLGYIMFVFFRILQFKGVLVVEVLRVKDGSRVVLYVLQVVSCMSFFIVLRVSVLVFGFLVGLYNRQVKFLFWVLEIKSKKEEYLLQNLIFNSF